MNSIEKHNNKLFEKFRQLNLSPNEYVIVSGGPLAARGLRTTSDVDVIVTERLFQELEKTNKVITKKNNEVTVEVINLGEDIEILHFIKETVRSGQPTLEEQIKSADVINGLHFQNLQHCLFFKKWSDRDKDKKDIALINEYLDRHPEEAKTV